MISVITPTNNPEYLGEAYNSLAAQSLKNWEWIVVPNGGVTWECSDKRVKTYPTDMTGSVGALKRFACERARGDIVVELDHDDMLTPNALAKIAAAFKDKTVGMVYSNCAEFFMPDWKPNSYKACFGWRYRPREFYGHEVQEALYFPPTPLGLAHINFASNHVRAWRRSEYWRIGGHDPDLPVADDHDLCCRMYLGSKLAHVNDCLYLYRIHDTNTWRTRNAEVQRLAWQTADKYRRRMAEHWCALEGLPMVDLGAGFDKPEGYQGLDLRNADIIADAREGLPFEDNSVGLIRAHDFLEHLPDKIGIMNEIWRVLVPGGWLFSLTPSTDGRGAFQDPTHVSYWNENAFWYYTKAGYAKYAPDIKCRFQTRRLRTYYPAKWQEQNKIAYVQADLVAIKDGMGVIPGLVEI